MQNGDTYNRGGFIAFVFSMVFSLAFFVYVGILHPGIDLKEVPEGVAQPEQTVAGTDAGGAAAPDVSGVENPWVSSDDLVAHGKQVYQANCAVCHGAGYKGDGPAGKALVPPPRNLIAGGWKKGGTSIELYMTLKNGIEGTSMASFAHLPKVDRWALVHLIRNITEDKPEDNPEKLEEFGKTAD